MTALALTLDASALRGQDLKSISLPPPQTQGGKPLLEALKLRRSTREFKRADLSDQALANLLWAGFGVNRPESGNRTAPSAMNSQEVDIYVALAQGLYLYDAKANELEAVSGEDLRAKTNRQPSIKDASAVLIFVADLSRLAKAKEEMRTLLRRVFRRLHQPERLSVLQPRLDWPRSCTTWTARRSPRP